MTLIEIAAIAGSLSFLVFIAYLIKKGRLREEYSILWLVINVVLLYFTFFRSQLDDLSAFFGVYYAPALLFLVAFAGVFLFLVHLSVVVSDQHKKIKKLTQEIALLKKKTLENDEKKST